MINLSSGISGSYQSATQAGEMIEGINVHTFDSRLAAMIEGSFVIYSLQLVEKGYTAEEIIKELHEIREHIGAYLIVDDLKTYKKWPYYWCTSMGRHFIKMKPVLRFEEDGKIHPHEKVRTKNVPLNR